MLSPQGIWKFVRRRKKLKRSRIAFFSFLFSLSRLAALRESSNYVSGGFLMKLLAERSKEQKVEVKRFLFHLKEEEKTSARRRDREVAGSEITTWNNNLVIHSHELVTKQATFRQTSSWAKTFSSARARRVNGAMWERGELFGGRGVWDEINNEVSDRGNILRYPQHLLLGISCRLARLTQLVFRKLKIFQQREKTFPLLASFSLFFFSFAFTASLRGETRMPALLWRRNAGKQDLIWFSPKYSISVRFDSREGEDPTTHRSRRPRKQSLRFLIPIEVSEWKQHTVLLREKTFPWRRFTSGLFINFALILLKSHSRPLTHGTKHYDWLSGFRISSPLRHDGGGEESESFHDDSLID